MCVLGWAGAWIDTMEMSAETAPAIKRPLPGRGTFEVCDPNAWQTLNGAEACLYPFEEINWTVGLPTNRGNSTLRSAQNSTKAAALCRSRAWRGWGQNWLHHDRRSNGSHSGSDRRVATKFVCGKCARWHQLAESPRSQTQSSYRLHCCCTGPQYFVRSPDHQLRAL